MARFSLAGKAGTGQLRCDQGDLAEAVEAPCRCGRAFPRLRLLGARSSDLIRLPDGSAVSALRVGLPLCEVAGVERFQVVQESLDRLVVRLVWRPGCDRQAVHDTRAQRASF